MDDKSAMLAVARRIGRLKCEIKSLTEQVFLEIVLMPISERASRMCHIAAPKESMLLLLKYHDGHKFVAAGKM
jgi:hypothetical protein